MPTETDLRNAIARVADRAPRADELLDRLELRSSPAQARRRSGLLPALAASAAVVVVAGVAAVAVNGSGDDGRPTSSAPAGAGPSVAHPCAAGGTPSFATIRMGAVPGVSSVPASEVSCSGVRERDLQTTKGDIAGAVEVFAPGVFDTRTLRHGSPVTGSPFDDAHILPNTAAAMVDVRNANPAHVAEECIEVDNLKPGQAVISPPGKPRAQGPCPLTGAVLVWRFGPDSWAAVGGAPGTSTANVQRLITMAKAVDTAHTDPVTVPFAARSLPTGVRIVDWTRTYSDHDALPGITIGLGRTGSAHCPAATVCSSFDEISVSRPGTVDRPTRGARSVDVNGHVGQLYTAGDRDERVVFFDVAPWQAEVGTDTPGQQLTDKALIALARSLRLAPSADRSTWFPLSSAFGG